MRLKIRELAFPFVDGAPPYPDSGGKLGQGFTLLSYYLHHPSSQ